MGKSKVIDCLKQFENYVPEQEVSRNNSLSDKTVLESNHIFEGLIAYVNNAISDKTTLTYYHCLSEKLLRVCKLKDKKLANYYLGKIELEMSLLNMSEGLEYHVIQSIFNPVLAYYYYYIQHDYESSEKYMLKVLTSIDFLIDHGFRDGIYMKIEQHLNTSRVYFNAGKYADASGYAREVICYLLSSKKESFKMPFAEVIASDQQYLEVVHLFLNGIIFKALANSNNNTFSRNFFLTSTFKDLNINYNHRIDLKTQSALEILVLISEGKEDEALDKITNTQLFFGKVPTSLQYFLLGYLVNYANSFEILPNTIRNNIEMYLAKELKLTPDQVNNLSPLATVD